MTSPEERKDDPEVRREKTIEHIRQRRKIKRRRRLTRKRHVLTMPCPSFACQKPITLLCPYCHFGTLDVDEHSLTLSCNHCRNVVRDIPCQHCGFILRPTYIYERKVKLKKLKENADDSKFWAIIITFATGIFSIWAILNLYS